MKMLSLLKFADIFTLANIASGFMAIIFAFDRMFDAAAIFILLALIFDFIDGRIARATKSQNMFGKELDSLSDMISFGAAPALIVYAIAEASSWIPLYILFLFCGALRLARFNILDIKGFIGMPITMNGLIFPLLILLDADQTILHAFMIASALLMVSSIKFRKI